MAFVEDAITVRVFEQADATDGLLSGPRFIRVVTHLTNEQVSLFIEGGGDGIGDQRLACDKLHLEPVHRFEAVEHVVDRFGGNWFQEFFQFGLGVSAIAGIDS